MQTFNPDKNVVLDDGSIVAVKLLKWKKALEFFNQLRERVKNLLDENGNLKLDTKKILDAISSNLDLLEWLIVEATEKDAAFIASLSITDVMKLAGKALEINLGSVATELKNVRGRLVAMATGNQAADEAMPKSNPTSPPSAT